MGRCSCLQEGREWERGWGGRLSQLMECKTYFDSGNMCTYMEQFEEIRETQGTQLFLGNSFAPPAWRHWPGNRRHLLGGKNRGLASHGNCSASNNFFFNGVRGVAVGTVFDSEKVGFSTFITGVRGWRYPLNACILGNTSWDVAWPLHLARTQKMKAKVWSNRINRISTVYVCERLARTKICPYMLNSHCLPSVS